MPNTIIRRVALASASGGLLVLAGCSAVSTNGPAAVVQPTPLSDTVAVSQPFCASAGATILARATPDAAPDCSAYSGFYDASGYQRFTTGGGGRLLVAVQVADGTADPTLALRRRPDVAFTQDPAVLADVPAAPDGRHWVGYRSGVIRFALDEANAGDVVDATVAIPRTATRPASEELATTIAIGDQVTENGFGAEYPADRAVSCDEDLSATPNHQPDISTTTCPGQQGSGPVANSAPASSTATVVPTDAAITTTGQEVAVAAGTTATVPFTVAQSGETPDASDLGLTASTSVPGGQATPSVTAVPWATTPTTTAARPTAARAASPDGTTDVAVTIAVPAGTAAGVYDVALTASDTGGSRSATAKVRVPGSPSAPTPAAPAPPAPTVPATPRKPISATVQLLRATTVSRRTRRVHLGSVTCVRDAGTCAIRSRVAIGGHTIGSVSVTAPAKSTKRVTLRLTRANLARLIARSATATTTVSAAGSVDIVRTTSVRAKKAPRKRG